MSSPSPSSSSPSFRRWVLFSAGPTVTGHRIIGGPSVNLLSSGIQKCIRRGEKELACEFARGWLSFQAWKNPSGPMPMRSVLTNFRNRVFAIIPFEDILAFAEIPLIVSICQFDQKIEKNSEKDESKYTIKDQSEDLRECMSLIRRLCAARKCRIASDYKFHYLQGVTDLSTRPLMKEDSSFFKALSTLQTHPLSDEWWRHFFSLFNEKDDQEGSTRRTSRLKLQGVFWKKMETQVVRENTLMKQWMNWCQVLHKKYRDKREGFLFPFHAIMSLVHRKKIVGEIAKQKMTPEEIKEKESLVLKLLEDPLPPIPDYAVDMHTAEGRALGKTSADFAREGALVIPEDKEYLRVEWRQAYVNSNEVRDEEEKESPSISPNSNSKKRTSSVSMGSELKDEETDPVDKKLKLKSVTNNLEELEEKQIVSSSISVSSSSSSSSSIPSLFIRDPLFGKNIKAFLSGYVKGKRRSYQHVSGTYMDIQFTDTTFMDPATQYIGESPDFKGKSCPPVLNVVTVGIEPDEMESVYRGKGIFTETLTSLLQVMRELGHWAYLRIECVNNERFQKFFARRNDVVYQDWSGHTYWIDTSPSNERRSKLPLIMTYKDLMKNQPVSDSSSSSSSSSSTYDMSE